MKLSATVKEAVTDIHVEVSQEQAAQGATTQDRMVVANVGRT
jgi:hypothetical protein